MFTSWFSRIFPQSSTRFIQIWTSQTALVKKKHDIAMKNLKNLLVPIPIRSLKKSQKPRIEKHLLDFDNDDRFLRFGYHASDDQIKSYVRSLNFERDDIYGIFNRRLQLIAMAHLAFGEKESRSANQVEFGVSVVKNARGRGYGALMFDRALTHARNKGATQMVIHALSENTAMLKIATNAGAKVERDGGESEAYLYIPPASISSHVEEIVDEQFAEFDYNLKLQVKLIGAALQDFRNAL